MFAVSTRHTNAGIKAKLQSNELVESLRLEIRRLKASNQSMACELAKARENIEKQRQELDRLAGIERFWESSTANAMDIIKAAGESYGLKPGDIRGESRDKHVVSCRMDAVSAIKWLRPDLSFPAIGRMMGGRDHTTILYSCRQRGYSDKSWPGDGPQFANADFAKWVHGEFYEGKDEGSQDQGKAWPSSKGR